VRRIHLFPISSFPAFISILQYILLHSFILVILSVYLHVDKSWAALYLYQIYSNNSRHSYHSKLDFQNKKWKMYLSYQKQKPSNTINFQTIHSSIWVEFLNFPVLSCKKLIIYIKIFYIFQFISPPPHLIYWIHVFRV